VKHQIMNKFILITIVIFSSVNVYSQTDSSKNKFKSQDYINKEDAKEDVEHYMNNSNKYMPAKDDTLGSKKIVEKYPDGFMMTKGIMQKYKNGKKSLLTKDVTLSNGTIIMSNGQYKKKGVVKIMFKEGEHMNLKGKLISMR